MFGGSSKMTTMWEYTMVSETRVNLTEALNKAGLSGWELVSVVFDNEFNMYVAVLKRQRRLF